MKGYQLLSSVHNPTRRVSRPGGVCCAHPQHPQTGVSDIVGYELVEGPEFAELGRTNASGVIDDRFSSTLLVGETELRDWPAAIASEVMKGASAPKLMMPGDVRRGGRERERTMCVM